MPAAECGPRLGLDRPRGHANYRPTLWLTSSRSSARPRRARRAVAEAVAARHPGRARLRRLDAGLPRPADPHESVGAAGAPRRRLAARRTRRRSASTSALAHAAIDEILAAGRTPIVVGGTGLYLRAALAELELPPPPHAGVARALAARSTTSAAERRPRRLAERDPAAAAAHPRERPPPRRPRARARRGGRVAPRRRGPALGGRDAPSDARRRARRAEGALERRIEERTRGDVRARGGGGGAPTLWQGRSRRPRGRCIGLREVAELPRERGDRGARDGARAATPPTSGSGCGAFPASLCRRRPADGGGGG